MNGQKKKDINRGRRTPSENTREGANVALGT